jgi:hypothetical protein
MKTLLTGVLALACSTSAFAQDALLATGTPERLPISLSSEPQPAAGKDWALAVLLEVDLPPEGDVETLEWKDVVGMGVGLRLELDRTWSLPGEIRLGIYGALGFMTHFGEEFTLGALNLEADDLMTLNLAVGGKIAYRPAEGLQVEGRLGLGITNYFESGIEEVGTGISADLIDSTQEFFFEAGARVGFVAGSVILQIGLTVRSQGEPEPADPTTIDYSGDALLFFGVDAGILIRF